MSAAKTAAERKAAERSRRKDAGQKQIWVDSSALDKVQALMQQREAMLDDDSSTLDQIRSVEGQIALYLGVMFR